MNSLTKAILSYEGIVVGVESDEVEDIKWVSEFLEPSFKVSALAPDVEVSLEADTTRFDRLMELGPSGECMDAFMQDRRVDRLPLWAAPGPNIVMYEEKRELFYLLQENRVVILGKTYQRRSRTRLMRVVREFAMGMAQATGGRFLHASAFVVDGRAAIITGPREAGKTSLLTYILSNTSADFLTNDRLLLKREGSTERARGMPTIISVRPGNFDLFPGLLASLNKNRFRMSSTLDECQASDAAAPQVWSEGRRALSPRQYCSLMDCAAVKEATAFVVLFPRQTGKTGGLSLRRLLPEQAEALLQRCLFGNINPNRLSDAFTRNPGSEIEVAPVSDQDFCGRLSKRLIGYECLLGNDAFADTRGADKLVELVTGQAPERVEGDGMLTASQRVF